jgi:hypothetical protein
MTISNVLGRWEDDIKIDVKELNRSARNELI